MGGERERGGRERKREREREGFHNDGQNLKYILINRFENGKSIFEIRFL